MRKAKTREVVFTFKTEEDAMRFIKQVNTDKFPTHRVRRGKFLKFYSELEWLKHYNPITR